ncbi:MAG: dephospho-CoA kinase [Desulfobacteraceae bacterium 4572_35.1]|nr:MAG: dephospho-CoA kinase [Desulfobacteraceae bacterium 4572_35.1]
MILGVTGGIASGKSTVAEMLHDLGAVVVSADQLARELVVPGSQLLDVLRQRFGAQIIAADGALDRARLGDSVFADSAARHDLDGIMHPAIAELSQRRLKEAVQQSSGGLVVYEAPLLYEAGASGRVDKVLAVIVADAVQLQRLCQRDNCDIDAARQRVAAHMPQSEKARRADYVIDNSAGVEHLRQQVAALYRQLVT